MKKNKLQKLLEVFSNSDDKNLEGFKAFDDGVSKLKAELKKKIQVNTLEEVNSELDKFRKRIDLDPIVKAVDSLREDFANELESLVEILGTNVAELSNMNTETNNKASRKSEELSDAISEGRGQIKDFISEYNNKLETLKKDLLDVSVMSNENTSKKFNAIDNEVSAIKADVVSHETDIESIDKKIKSLENEFPTLRTDLMNRMSERGGGNMNRQIVVGGNPSTLSKYTDINLKAGNNVSISYASNETTKRTDITISATGGGGSSTAGIIRSINTINTSQTAGDTVGTDYVYICTAGVRLELPIPLGNSNLYTVKNYSASSVLVAGTIDSDVNGIIMPIQYTSVDLVSNEVDNFNLT